jgi:hypothetical protein
MPTLHYKRATTYAELEQIRALQIQNSISNITPEEKQQEGFVTVQHTVELLEQMNNACAHIIAKEGEDVVGFALVMLPEFRNEIEVLVSMFDRIDSLLPNPTSYVVMGQICVAKKYRKQGVFRGLYSFYKEQLQGQFDFLITDVAVINERSMQAHEAIGFKIIDTYEEDKVVWNIIAWDWSA